MCDPITATVIGTGMLASGWATNNQTKSANRNAQAMQTAKENKYKESMDRQDAYADESRSAFNTNLQKQGTEGFNEQLEASSEKRNQAFADAKGEDGDYAVTGSTPKNVILAQQKAFGDVDDKQSASDAAFAKLTGYGDTQFEQGLSRNAFGRNVGNITDKAGGDMRLLPLDMQQAASNAYKAPNTGLTLAKQAGKLATMYGAAGTPGLNTTGATVARPNQAFVGPMPKQPHFGGYI